MGLVVSTKPGVHSGTPVSSLTDRLSWAWLLTQHSGASHDSSL